MEKKSIITYVILIFVVVIIILSIKYLKRNGNGNEAIQCIAEHSVLVVKEGCPACAYQKNIIGEENLDKFKIIDCAEEPEKCAEFNISHIPTWIINNEKYEGARSIKELKELTGC